MRERRVGIGAGNHKGGVPRVYNDHWFDGISGDQGGCMWYPLSKYQRGDERETRGEGVERGAVHG
jgi:hypothetical protein